MIPIINAVFLVFNLMGAPSHVDHAARAAQDKTPPIEFVTVTPSVLKEVH